MLCPAVLSGLTECGEIVGDGRRVKQRVKWKRLKERKLSCLPPHFTSSSTSVSTEKSSAVKHTGRLKVSLIKMPKAYWVKLINIHSFRHSTALLAKWLSRISLIYYEYFHSFDHLSYLHLRMLCSQSSV